MCRWSWGDIVWYIHPSLWSEAMKHGEKEISRPQTVQEQGHQEGTRRWEIWVKSEPCTKILFPIAGLFLCLEFVYILFRRKRNNGTLLVANNLEQLLIRKGKMLFPCQCKLPSPFLHLGGAEQVVVLIEWLQCEKVDLRPTMTRTICFLHLPHSYKRD